MLVSQKYRNMHELLSYAVELSVPNKGPRRESSALNKIKCSKLTGVVPSCEKISIIQTI